MERAAAAVDEGGDAVHLLGVAVARVVVRLVVGSVRVGVVMVVPVVVVCLVGRPIVRVVRVALREQLPPPRRLGGAGGVVQAAAEEAVGVDRRVDRPEYLGVGPQAVDEFLHGRQLGVGDEVGLVQHHDVRQLDLFDEEVRQRPRLAVDPPALGPPVAAERGEELVGVDHGDQGVDLVAR